nr:hypothetical protein [Pandoravirus aubagnensis]
MQRQQDLTCDCADAAHDEKESPLDRPSMTTRTDNVSKEQWDARAHNLDGLAQALSRLASKRYAAAYEYLHGAQEKKETAHDQIIDTEDLRALCDTVCHEWKHILRRHASSVCDARGLDLCVAAVERLGLTVHVVDTDAVEKDDDPLFPKMKYSCRSHSPRPSDDDPAEHVGPDDDVQGEPTDCAIDDKRSIGTTQGNRALPMCLFLTCSRPLACVGQTRDEDPSIARLALKVCIGVDNGPWATAGSVVDVETGVVIPIGCTLVSHPPLAQRGDHRLTMAMKRCRLADFLASGKRTWKAFAQQRYAPLRRVPGVLARHGWTVKENRHMPWSWSTTALPNAEYDARALVLRREDVPVPVGLFLIRGRLAVVPGGATGHIDGTPRDIPGVFGSDPIDAMTYPEADLAPPHRRDHLFDSDYRSFQLECARQRAKLVGMGLVSPLVILGRQDRFCERVGAATMGDDQYDCEFLRPVFANRVVACDDLDRLTDIIEQHVAQSVFGEYGPVDAATGRYLNGGTCDDLVDEAIGSGRLLSGLACATAVSCKMYEAPVDPFDSSSTADDAPRLIVNWRGQFQPACAVPRNGEKRLPLIVSAAIVLQTNGCGGAYVAVSIPKSKVCLVLGRARPDHTPSLTRPQWLIDSDSEDDRGLYGDNNDIYIEKHQNHNVVIDDIGNDDVDNDDVEHDHAVWRALVARCARAPITHPPDLHPVLMLALETERERSERACFVPWAYRTDERGAVDVQTLTVWVLDRVTEIMTAFGMHIDTLCSASYSR